MGASSAFTLVELLVVIAITVILFALLLRPLVESLRLTQSAQVQAAAQDAARITLERLTRELGSAVYVYDNNSHPFVNATKTVANVRPDRFTNFLDLEVTKSDGTYAVEHAYNAKLDIVSARHSGTSFSDPTAPGEPVQLKGGKTGAAVLSNTGLLFPLAPGSNISRYFIGLKRPVDYTQTPAAQGHYSNSNEGLLAAASSTEDNTYILYDAQIAPYQSVDEAKSSPNSDKTTVNEKYFAPAHDSAGNVVNMPELDDPDFFRYVTTSNVNWLSDTHTNYSQPEADAHNARVENWAKIAKPVITAPDIDLLLLPHNPDGSIAYDTATGALQNVAHSGTSYDTVTGTIYPTINTSVTFQPATVQGDAAPSTTTDYASLGIPANAADNGGLPYIPTLYTASNQSLVNPPVITLTPNIGNNSVTNVPYYTTQPATTTVAAANSVPGVSAGDLMEFYHTSSTDTTGTAVFDITQGVVLANAAGHYVPLSVNLNTGTLNFDTPAFPDPPNQDSKITKGYDPYLRFWSAAPVDINNGNLQACLVDTNAPNGHDAGVLDLTNLVCDNAGNGQLAQLGAGGSSNTSPLPAIGANPTGLQCANAFIVPGSVRVYGPDATPGPNLGNRVLYTPVSPGTPLGFNEYRVDYLNSRIYFNVDNAANGPQQANQLPTTPALGNTLSDVQIAFDYQANLTPVDPSDAVKKPLSPTNPANPMLVKVDYQTRDLLDINIGVRIYDSSQGRSVTIPVHNRVQIGNSNR